MKKINILVTGCGGDIGQSIGKILVESDYVNNLYGCDISEKNAGKFIFTNFFIGLKCTDENYLINLQKIVSYKEIDLIIPIAEPEIRFFSKNGIAKIGNCNLLIASSEALEIGFDKELTSKFLQENSLPFPVTYSVNEIEKPEKFPVIMKSKTGSGSANVSIVSDIETFQNIKTNNPDFIVQEYLDGKQGEYTCGLFRAKDLSIRSIIIKRELMGGFTGYGEIIKNDEITETLSAIAKKINLIGSINVQLRLTDKGPVVFEINPRFSSTVRFRHLLGFKDLDWSIEDMFDEKITEYKDDSEGKKIFKGFNEYIS